LLGLEANSRSEEGDANSGRAFGMVPYTVAVILVLTGYRADACHPELI